MPLYFSMGYSFYTNLIALLKMNETAPKMNIKINNYYKKRTDGTIGRSLLLSYHGCRSIDNAKVEIISKEQKEQ